MRENKTVLKHGASLATVVSSNNIYWETTETPIRMIHVPWDNSFVTLINPKYQRLAGRSVNSAERCGSIPDQTFVVKRKAYVVISGYDLDGDAIELEYGSNAGLYSRKTYPYVHIKKLNCKYIKSMN